MDKVKHHTFAHLVLFVFLAALAMFVFGGVTEGPLMSFLYIGANVYNLFRTASGGNVNSIGSMTGDIMSLLIVFIINLVIFYILSSIIIVIFNLFFGEKKK